MNKTVNINLAGTFFHIDENAFGKLQRYLEAIKRSLSDPQGSDEIIKDIEARIAELFSEKIESSSQVVSIKELDEVIAVMGQPEDYMVDEEIFEDAPPSSKRRAKSASSHRQLFRDVDNKFIAGVSSGLGHYLGIDAIWLRLIWILLTVFSSGIFIVFYILFWILVPAAESTSDKLKMSGEAVNISNIEKKLKEQLENATEKVKNADYDKYGEKVKKGASGFFDTLGSILLTLVKIFVKFIGVILVFVSLVTIIGLIIGAFSAGSIGFWGHGEIMDLISITDPTNTPLWLLSLLALLAVGIPFFALFILGLKLLIDNLKSIGTPAKIILLILWIASIIGLSILGVKQATEQAYDAEAITETVLPVRSGDTLRVEMRSDSQYDYSVYRSGGPKIKYDSNDEKILYSNDIRLIVRSTDENEGKIIVEKRAEGSSYLEAKKRAEDIEYSFNIENGLLTLDGFFLTDIKNKYRNQEIYIILYLPEGSILYAEKNTYSFHRNSSYYRDILDNGDEQQYLLIEDGNTRCTDCPSFDRTNDRSIDRTENRNWENEVNEDFGDNSNKVEEVVQPNVIIDSVQQTVTDSINNSANNK